MSGQAALTSIANTLGSYLIQVTVVRLLEKVWPWTWQRKAYISASCVLVSVTEASSKLCQNCDFFGRYENVGLFGT